MATKAQLTKEAKAIGDQLRTTISAFNKLLVSRGGNAINEGDFYAAIQQQMAGGIAGTVAYVQYPNKWFPIGITKKSRTLLINMWGKILSLWTQLVTIENILHPEGFDVLGILPLLFVGAVTGAAAVVTAVGAAGTGAGAGAAAAQAGAAGAGSAGAGGAAAGGSAAGGAAGGGAAAGTLAPVVVTATPEAAAGGVGAATEAVGTAAVTAAANSAEQSAANAVSSSNSAGSTLNKVSGLVGSELTKLTGSSVVGQIGSSIINGVGSLVVDFEKYFGPLISFAEKVFTDIQQIDNKYIIPLTTTLTKEYDTVSGTISVIKSLTHEGLQGILAIPTAISTAFKSLESGAVAAADITNTNQSSLVKEDLVPSITKGVGEPIANFAEMFHMFSKPILTGVGALPSVSLSESIKNNTFNSLIQARMQKLTDEGGFWNSFWAAFYDAIQFLLDAVGDVEAAATASTALGMKAGRPEPMTPGEALEAWLRGIISNDDVDNELAFRGYSAERTQALKDLKLWIPDIREAIDMYYRRVISGDDMRKVLAKHGIHKTDADALLAVVLEPVNPREAIAANGRQAMKDAGWLPHSLGTDVPAEFTALYTPRFANPNIGKLDWLEHWKLPDIEWWFVAYFRNLVTKEDVINAANAENWPQEVIDKMFAVRQELIQEWMIPDILSSGILSEQQALEYMSYAGIEPHSAQILLQWGLKKANQTNAQKALSLADKFEAASKAMFQDGIINKDEYNLLLLDQGFNTEQAALMVELAQHELDLAARKTFADLQIKRVLTGQIPLSTMQSELYSEGFTETEVNRYVTQVQTAMSDTTKFPTTAEALDLMKKGIITPAQCAEALRVMGWAPFWQTAWLQYAGVSANESTVTVQSVG